MRYRRPSWPLRLVRRARDRQRGLGPRRRRLRRARRARASRSRRRARSRRTTPSKAQGGIQAAFGEDDSPEQHAEDVWRSSHETADRRLVEVLTSEAPSRDPLARGAGRRVHARERRLPPRPLRRRVAKRLLQVGDRTGHAITKALREAWEAGSGTSFENAPLRALEPTRSGWRARCGEHEIDAATVVLAAGGRCYAEAQERGELSTNHPNATGEVTRLALDARRRGARPRRAPVPPERRRVAREHAGLLDPGDDARLRRRAAERRRRGVHRLARPARRRRAGDRRRGRDGRGVETPDGRPAVYLDTTRISRGRRRGLAAVHAAPLPRGGHRPAAPRRSSPTPCSTTRTAAS